MAATLYPMTGFEFVSDSAPARDAARPLEAFLRGVERRAWRVADSPEILLSSFSIEALAAAAAHVPELPRALLVESHTPQNLALALQLGCVSLNVGCNGLEAKHVSDTLSAGLRVMAYTVNTCEAAAQLTDWGVCGLFTDRPDLLHARQT